MRSAREGDELRTGMNMRALLSAIASGKEEIERIGRKHGWSVGIKEEMLDRLQAMIPEPIQRGSDVIMSSIPPEWREQATERVSEADRVIQKMTYDRGLVFAALSRLSRGTRDGDLRGDDGTEADR
jgi:hypothetical protein